MLCLSGFELYSRWVPLSEALVSGGSRGGAPRALPLLLDQTEVSQGLDASRLTYDVSSVIFVHNYPLA